MHTAFAPGRFEPTSTNAGMYFGHDLQAALLTWWREELVPEVRASRMEQNFDLAAVVLEQTGFHTWTDPLADVLHHLTLGDPEDDRYAGGGGLYRNIAGKLRFALRTGMPSSYARECLHLLLSGDFPYKGAVNHRGFWVAVSGLSEDEDEQVGVRLADKLVDLRTPLAKAAIKASKNRTPATPFDVKYLGADPAMPEGHVNFAFNPFTAAA